jgi:hypothetical protein
LAAHTRVYEQVFRSFYDSTLALYVDQYGLFGDPEVLPTKVIWDYTYYWSVLAQMFCQERLTDLASLSHLRDELAVCQQLNLEVQHFLRAWGEVSQCRNPAVMLDQASVPWFVELNRSLRDSSLSDSVYRQRIRDAALTLQRLNCCSVGCKSTLGWMAARCKRCCPRRPCKHQRIACYSPAPQR